MLALVASTENLLAFCSNILPYLPEGHTYVSSRSWNLEKAVLFPLVPWMLQAAISLYTEFLHLVLKQSASSCPFYF